MDALTPILVRIFIASLSSAVFQPTMKHTAVVPMLKNAGSDTSVRPISNITFVAKTTERYVTQQLQHFMEVNGIYGVYKNAYRSAETALVRLHNFAQ